MQVYKYMDIGTAKPTPDERAVCPHHLIDIIFPDENYTAGRFVEDSEAIIKNIIENNNIPLLVGGTGLYLKALFNGLFDSAPTDHEVRSKLKKRLEGEGREKLYSELKKSDPVSAEKIHINDTQRLIRALEIFHVTGVPWSQHVEQQKSLENNRTNLLQNQKVLKIGLTCDRDYLYGKINNRVEHMVTEGLLDEAKTLLEMGYGPFLNSMQSIGYRHMINYLEGIWTWEKSLEMLARDTRRYAKRQFTWFGRDPDIKWFHVGDQDKIVTTVKDFIKER